MGVSHAVFWYNGLMFRGLYKFGENFIKILAVLFCLLIFVSSFLLISENYDMTSHSFDISFGNSVASGIGLLAFLGIAFFFYCLVCKAGKKGVRIFLFITLGIVLLMCEYMAFFGRSMPNSDCWSVYDMAKRLADGDYTVIHPTDSYMSFYPQQLGLCAFLSFFIKIVDLIPVAFEEFHILQAIYGVFECITVLFLYLCVDNLWEKESADFLVLFFSIFNLPYIMYSSYLYGEIPALMFFLIGTFFIIRQIKLKGIALVNIPFSVIGFTLAVLVRKNTLVLIIAVVIVCFLEALKDKRWLLLISSLIIALMAILVLPITVKCYEKKADSTLSKGVTPKSYIAMGMQDTAEEPGWYNGFNINTFIDASMDCKEADRISEEAIEERVDFFKKNKKDAFQFYKRKFFTQWVDGTYFSRESTATYYGDRSNFLMKLYFGEYGKYYVYFCDIFQTVIFFGSFLWAIFSINPKKKNRLFESMLFIGVFGGFLFHMLWEANSRYILTYAFLLLPYAAGGYMHLIDGVKFGKRH